MHLYNEEIFEELESIPCEIRQTLEKLKDEDIKFQRCKYEQLKLKHRLYKRRNMEKELYASIDIDSDDDEFIRVIHEEDLNEGGSSSVRYAMGFEGIKKHRRDTNSMSNHSNSMVTTGEMPEGSSCMTRRGARRNSNSAITNSGIPNGEEVNNTFVSQESDCKGDENPFATSNPSSTSAPVCLSTATYSDDPHSSQIVNEIRNLFLKGRSIIAEKIWEGDYFKEQLSKHCRKLDAEITRYEKILSNNNGNSNSNNSIDSPAVSNPPLKRDMMEFVENINFNNNNKSSMINGNFMKKSATSSFSNSRSRLRSTPANTEDESENSSMNNQSNMSSALDKENTNPIISLNSNIDIDVQVIIPSLAESSSSVIASQTTTQNQQQSSPLQDNNAASSNALIEEPLYCFCRQVSFGDMVECDNGEKCPYGWFHYPCVGLSSPPKGDSWYCSDCLVNKIYQKS